MDINKQVDSVIKRYYDQDGFSTTDSSMPEYKDLTPTVPIEPPENCGEIVYDTYNNYWVLEHDYASGISKLLVLPSQEQDFWMEDNLSGLKEGAWKFLIADEHGFLWIADSRNIMRMNPKAPEEGWLNFSGLEECSRGKIISMAVGPSGSIMIALDKGKILELDAYEKEEKNCKRQTVKIRVKNAPAGIVQMFTDDEGSIWVKTEKNTYICAAEEKAWQKHWKLVARMPGGNHDLSGDIMNWKFYMAGGLTDGRGYPAKPHVSDELFEFNPLSNQWRVAAILGYGRCYNATSFVNGKVWIIGGDVFPKGEERHAVTKVQIIDLLTGEIAEGPEVKHPRPMPLAFNVRGRIYVIGNPRGEFDMPGKIESIGSGESSWREENQGPEGMGPLAGAVLEDKIYISVPHKFIAVYDTVSGSWDKIIPPVAPRSCQMTAYKGEILVMGGRIGEPGGTVEPTTTTETIIYSPLNGTWRKGPELPREIAWGVAFVINDRLFITGGAGGRCYNNRTFELRD